MAPHTENHPGGSCLLPKQSSLGVTKNNAGKLASGGGGSPPFRGRDLQSAMQHAPTIRVIHIFAPKVIKTDVANFRSTVQKLTGRGKTKSQRRAARAAMDCTTSSLRGMDVAPEGLQHNMSQAGGGCLGGVSQEGLFWDQQADQEKEVLTLQRMVGDACGVSDHLVRCDSVDSATYSLDSGNTFSGDSSHSNGAGAGTTSPTDHHSFSFYPQRETPYSLSEIPAPFFGGHVTDMHNFGVPTMSTSSSLPLHSATSTTFGVPGNNNVLMGLPTSHLMDHNLSSLGFDVDSVGLLPLPTLSDVAPLGCNSSSSGGSLFDLMPRQHCRLSVQSPYQGANFFEPI